MDTNLKNKHVLLTGASGGIGYSCAKLLDEEGAKLSLHYNSNFDNVKKLGSDLKGEHTYIQADLTQENSVTLLFSEAEKTYGAIDHLIVNHGIWPEEDTPIHKMDVSRWDQTIAVNLRAAFLCTKYFIQNLEKHKSDKGSIVYIGSTAGVFGEAYHSDYSVSKSGLYGLMLTAKNEIVHIARFGRVNIVAPGWVLTPMSKDFANDPRSVKKALKTMSLRKIARPKDIASTVVFLISDKLSGHISGQILTVAGGMEGRTLFESDEIDINLV